MRENLDPFLIRVSRYFKQIKADDAADAGEHRLGPHSQNFTDPRFAFWRFAVDFNVLAIGLGFLALSAALVALVPFLQGN